MENVTKDELKAEVARIDARIERMKEVLLQFNADIKALYARVEALEN